MKNKEIVLETSGDGVPQVVVTFKDGTDRREIFELTYFGIRKLESLQILKLTKIISQRNTIEL